MFGGGGSIQLVRIFGIRIGVNASWFFVLFLMIYGLSGYFGDVLRESDTTTFAIAVAGAGLFFASLVLHELGHALVARRSGIEIIGIDLWLFGGLAKLSRDSESPGEEFRVAAAGPLVTLALVGICVGVSALLSQMSGFTDAATFGDATTTPGVALAGWLAFVNAFLFAFNMLPAFPLDGGRIARAILWKITGDRGRATTMAGRLGEWLSYMLAGAGVLIAVQVDAINGIWICLLALFINQGARGAVAAGRFSDRIGGVTAEDLMDDEPIAIPQDATALQAQDDYFTRYGGAWLPVIDSEDIYLGVLRGDRVAGAVAAGQPALRVAELLDEESTSEELQIGRDTPLEALLTSEPLRRLGALAVVGADRRLLGTVTVEQVRRAVAASFGQR